MKESILSQNEMDRWAAVIRALKGDLSWEDWAHEMGGVSAAWLRNRAQGRTQIDDFQALCAIEAFVRLSSPAGFDVLPPEAP